MAQPASSASSPTSSAGSPQPAADHHHHRTRRYPNIVVTGTPGTGKTTHCEALVARVTTFNGESAATSSSSASASASAPASASDLPRLRHLAVNDVVKTTGCHDGWDAAYQSWLVDEDRLLDALEPALTDPAGGCLVDWHACDLFPPSWVDLVVVLTADTAALYDRLIQRNYPDTKLQENIDAEIMQVLLEEAHDAFDPAMVVPLASNTPDDMEANVDRILAWIAQWRIDHGTDGGGGGEAEIRGEA